MTTLADLDVAGKRVFLRCDLNVPLKEGKITDENRLVAALPTIKKLKQLRDGGIDVSKFVEQSIKMLQELKAVMNIKPQTLEQ